MAELLPEIFDALSATTGNGHHHFAHVLAHNANANGAEITIRDSNAKQEIIPALKRWILDRPDDHGVAASLSFDAWSEDKYVEIFGEELATKILAYNQQNMANLSTPPRTGAGGSTAATAPAVTPFSPEMLQSMIADAVTKALEAKTSAKTSPPPQEEEQPVDADPSFAAMLDAQQLAPEVTEEEVIFEGVKPAAAVHRKMTVGAVMQRLQAMTNSGASSATPVDLSDLGFAEAAQASHLVSPPPSRAPPLQSQPMQMSGSRSLLPSVSHVISRGAVPSWLTEEPYSRTLY